MSHIIVSQILPRRSPPQIFPPYNTKVNQLNRSLHHLFKATLFATFWLHPRILHSRRRILLRDGIHLNFAGNHILYHSYQKAIMYCLSRHNSIIPNPRPVFVLRPKSLMISHTAQPLVFFSETKLMHLTTRLKAIPAGPSLQISNNCSSTQQEFFDSLLNSIHGTQKVATRLLSLSSFSNLLECDSYLRRYFTYATGLPSRMVCPRHYRSSLEECKAWVFQACNGLSSHEKLFLSTYTRQRRSSFMCHAGFFGLFRKIYTSLGHSCEPTIVSNLKSSLRHMSAGLGYAHSITRVLNGKVTYLVKTTDALTTTLLLLLFQSSIACQVI